MVTYSNKVYGFCYRCRKRLPIYKALGKFYCSQCNLEVKKIHLSKDELKASLDLFKV